MSIDRTRRLQEKYLAFEKQYGTREDMEETVMTKRRHQLEEAIAKEPMNYDNWFDYVKMEE